MNTHLFKGYIHFFMIFILNTPLLLKETDASKGILVRNELWKIKRRAGLHADNYKTYGKCAEINYRVIPTTRYILSFAGLNTSCPFTGISNASVILMVLVTSIPVLHILNLLKSVS
jgi:hypothetical protein